MAGNGTVCTLSLSQIDGGFEFDNTELMVLQESGSIEIIESHFQPHSNGMILHLLFIHHQNISVSGETKSRLQVSGLTTRASVTVKGIQKSKSNKEKGTQNRRKRDSDWRAALDEDDRPLYDLLRKWRKEKAGREAVPPFLVLRNSEMAEVVANKPVTMANLRQIRGIGEAKCKHHGGDIIGIVEAWMGLEEE